MRGKNFSCKSRFSTCYVSLYNKRFLTLLSLYGRVIQDIDIICAFGETVEELSSKIGEELAVEVSSMRDINPAVWTPALEKYLDAIFEETMDNFQTKVLTKLLGMEMGFSDFIAKKFSWICM